MSLPFAVGSHVSLDVPRSFEHQQCFRSDNVSSDTTVDVYRFSIRYCAALNELVRNVAKVNSFAAVVCDDISDWKQKTGMVPHAQCCVFLKTVRRMTHAILYLGGTLYFGSSDVPEEATSPVKEVLVQSGYDISNVSILPALHSEARSLSAVRAAYVAAVCASTWLEGEDAAAVVATLQRLPASGTTFTCVDGTAESLEVEWIMLRLLQDSMRQQSQQQKRRFEPSAGPVVQFNDEVTLFV